MEQPSQPTTGDSVKYSHWYKAATLSLIELHKQNQKMFVKPSVKQRYMYMAKNKPSNDGKKYVFTHTQCEQKCKNLTKVYRDTVDHNCKTGNERKKECRFFKSFKSVVAIDLMLHQCLHSVQILSQHHHLIQ